MQHLAAIVFETLLSSHVSQGFFPLPSCCVRLLIWRNEELFSEQTTYNDKCTYLKSISFKDYFPHISESSILYFMIMCCPLLTVLNCSDQNFIF